MNKSKINCIEDGFIALYKDLKFDTDSNKVFIPKKESELKVILNDKDDYQFMFEQLTQFTVAEESVNIIKLRYGLDTGVAYTLKECGEKLCVTDECVRSKISTAFRKIKHTLNIRSAIGRLQLSEKGMMLLENTMREGI